MKRYATICVAILLAAGGAGAQEAVTGEASVEISWNIATAYNTPTKTMLEDNVAPGKKLGASGIVPKTSTAAAAIEAVAKTARIPVAIKNNFYKDGDGSYKPITLEHGKISELSKAAAKERYTDWVDAKTYTLTWHENSPQDYTVHAGGISVGFKTLHSMEGISTTIEPKINRITETLVLADEKAATKLQWFLTRNSGWNETTLDFYRFRIQKPFAFDADSVVVPVSWTVKGDTLTYNVDASKAKYPVTVDPDITLGDEAVYVNSNTGAPLCVYDASAGKHLILWKNITATNKGTAVVATISGTSITFGDSAFYSTGGINATAACYDASAGKILVGYAKSDVEGIVKIATISGTSVSFGDSIIFNAQRITKIAMSYDPSAGKSLIADYNANYNSTGWVRTATISGSSVTFGDDATYSGRATTEINMCYSAKDSKSLIAYSHGDGRGIIRSLSISGTSVTVGDSIIFTDIQSAYIAVAHDENTGKNVLFYRNGLASYGLARYATISGASVTLGDTTLFGSNICTHMKAQYDASAKKILLVYRDASLSNYGVARTIDTSGTTISFGDSVAFAGTAIDPFVSHDIAQKKNVIVYRDDSNSNFGTAIVASLPAAPSSHTSPSRRTPFANDPTPIFRNDPIPIWRR